MIVHRFLRKFAFNLFISMVFSTVFLLNQIIAETSSSPSSSSAFFSSASASSSIPSCDSLLLGQYLCSPPEIDPETQQPVGCGRDNLAPVLCEVIDGLECDTLTANRTFTKFMECRYTSGKDFRTALLLSIFFGWLGIDRFYLGYAAVGLFKLLTFGFFFIFHLIDIILIALQIVGPADGSGYLIDYYGPKASYIAFSNTTYIGAPVSNSQLHEL